MAKQDVWAVFWRAPGQWRVKAPFSTHENIVAHLKPIFGEAASINEQTATQTVIGHVGCHAFQRAKASPALLGPRSGLAP